MNRDTPLARYLREPYMLYLVFVGVGLGTALMDQHVRLGLLSALLILLSVLYRGQERVESDYQLANVGRGALLGLVLSLPILAFLAEPLRVFTERLYGTSDVVFIFYQVCLISAPVEEYFFRGIVQPRGGASIALALYAAVPLIYFLFHAQIVAALLVFVGMGLVGMLCGYVREQYGLAAAIACHTVIVFVMQVLPSAIHAGRAMFA